MLAAGAAGLVLAPAGAFAKLSADRLADQNLIPYVNTFIGTGAGAPDYGLGNAAGDTPPGAAYPFGMVLWSPDTTTAAGGYRYEDRTLRGFSLTHFSGRGVSCYQDFPFIPAREPPAVSPELRWSDYRPEFSHAHEAASPGYYRVRLMPSGTEVELTVTPRTGFARFTFANTPTGTLLINAGGSANGDGFATRIDVVGRNTLTGYASSGNCGGPFLYRIYFAARFNRPFAHYGTWTQHVVTAGGRSAHGMIEGAYVAFDTSALPRVLAKVGISFVSVGGALENLKRENASWDFVATRQAAAAAWNHRLNVIQIQGGSEAEQTVFYTALYHALINPSVFNDADGRYLGFDGKVHRVLGFTQYHNISTWDIYRSEAPLLAVIAPTEAADIAQSLVNDAEQDPSGGLPRWEHANTNSGGMVGDGGDVIIASAYAFGARHFDARGALTAMDRGGSRVGTTSAGKLVRPGLDDYLRLGYVAAGGLPSAALTLEYANDDFAISQLAKELGNVRLSRDYLKRSRNWRRLFSHGYIVPRRADGAFIPDFRPANYEGFVESSGAQYVWMVPFDMHGLFALIGGDRAAVARLDHHFEQLNAGPASEFAFMGNEPELKAPWSYVFAGAPWRTQAVVRQILLQLFRDDPGGMPGNDDGGAMGSWVVWASIGLFPNIPGVGGFVVGSPLYRHVTIRLPHGPMLDIMANGADDNAPYVQRMSLNGRRYEKAWLPWAAIAGGGRLEFTLATSPNKRWATSPDAAPVRDHQTAVRVSCSPSAPPPWSVRRCA